MRDWLISSSRRPTTDEGGGVELRTEWDFGWGGGTECRFHERRRCRLRYCLGHNIALGAQLDGMVTSLALPMPSF